MAEIVKGKVAKVRKRREVSFLSLRDFKNSYNSVPLFT